MTILFLTLLRDLVTVVVACRSSAEHTRPPILKHFHLPSGAFTIWTWASRVASGEAFAEAGAPLMIRSLAGALACPHTLPVRTIMLSAMNVNPITHIHLHSGGSNGPALVSVHVGVIRNTRQRFCLMILPDKHPFGIPLGRVRPSAGKHCRKLYWSIVAPPPRLLQ